MTEKGGPAFCCCCCCGCCCWCCFSGITSCFFRFDGELVIETVGTPDEEEEEEAEEEEEEEEESGVETENILIFFTIP